MPLLYLKEQITATTADFDGNFTIDANNGDVVVVSYVGLMPLKSAVDSATLTVLLESSTLLDEVVCYKLWTKSKSKSLTGSVGTVSAAALTKEM